MQEIKGSSSEFRLKTFKVTHGAAHSAGVIRWKTRTAAKVAFLTSWYSLSFSPTGDERGRVAKRLSKKSDGPPTERRRHLLSLSLSLSLSLLAVMSQKPVHSVTLVPSPYRSASTAVDVNPQIPATFHGNVGTFCQIFGWIVLSAGLASSHSWHLESSLWKPRFQNGSRFTEEEHWCKIICARKFFSPTIHQNVKNVHNLLYFPFNELYFNWGKGKGQCESKVAKKKLLPLGSSKTQSQEGSLGWYTNQSTTQSLILYNIVVSIFREKKQVGNRRLGTDWGGTGLPI